MSKDNLKIIELKESYKLQNIPYNESIWGHRFRTEQTPMLLLFELLCVIENQYQAKNKGFIEKIFSEMNNKLYFKHKLSIKLRILLYRNEVLETIHRSKLSEIEKWEQQSSYLRNLKINNSDCFDDDDILYIRQNFTSFNSFYHSLHILGSLTFDLLSDKRWTSKFVYPLSKEYIWCDCGTKDLAEDRRFFARGGEIIYLMLCRSSEESKEALEHLFSNWFEDNGNLYSRLANLLVKNEERRPLDVTKKLGYLPSQNMKCFDTLAKDMIKILNLPLERLDMIKLFSDIIGFHMGNYIYSVNEKHINLPSNNIISTPTYLAEVLTKSTSSIRKLSIASVSTHRNRIKNLLLTNITALSGFKPNITDNENDHAEITISKQEALDYFNKNISGYPNVCFKEIGFISKKNARYNRYVITENFLHSLVIIILGKQKRLEFKKFMKELRETYNIYIDQQPPDLSDIDQRDLTKNSKNLSILLYQMGMLRHLSDACSYVINPYMEDML